MDLSAFLGILVGIGAILGGQALEGGSVKSLTQPTAFIIVVLGALGATLASFPLSAAKASFAALRKVFFHAGDNGEEYIQEIIRYAAKARKNGIISLEADIKAAKDPFLQKALRFVVDGVDPKVLQGIMETELNRLEEEGEVPVKFFEGYGAYLPTLGIIGAVLGLIQVMQNLNDPSKLGEGIAVAFVATVYGLVAANILMLPWAGKLKFRHKEEMTVKAMILEGVLAMQAGEHPQIIEERLKAYIQTHGAEAKKK